MPLESFKVQSNGMTHAHSLKNELPITIRAFDSTGDDGEQPVTKPAAHNYIEVLWIITGKGTCFIDLDKIELLDNMILCFRPGQPYRLHATGNLSGYSISFAESFLFMEDRSDGTGRQPA